MITKDMLIAEVIEKYPQVVQTMMMSGMGCVHCAIAHGESLADGAMAHGIDPDELVNALNDVLKATGVNA